MTDTKPKLNRREKARKVVYDYLTDKSCEECGEDRIACLQFDHIDRSKKSFNISRGISNGLSVTTILAEIDKCRILCANCHSIHTASQFNWYANILENN